MALPTSKLPSVRRLIERHRQLASSKNRLVRQIGKVLATSMLDRRLTQLSDRQIGQMVRGEVERGLPLFEPETAILQQASTRLFRSVAGALSNDDIASQRRQIACPSCRNEMLLHYGIDEPNFYECVSLRCGHKQFIE